MPLSTIFQLFRGSQFYWWRKPPTCRKLLTNLYRVHIAWAGFELAPSVVVGTDCTGSLKANYHAIICILSTSVSIVCPFSFGHCIVLSFVLPLLITHLVSSSPVCFYFCGVSVDSWLYGIVFFLAIQCLWKDDYILHVYKRGGTNANIFFVGSWTNLQSNKWIDAQFMYLSILFTTIWENYNFLYEFQESKNHPIFWTKCVYL